MRSSLALSGAPKELQIFVLEQLLLKEELTRIPYHSKCLWQLLEIRHQYWAQIWLSHRTISNSLFCGSKDVEDTGNRRKIRMTYFADTEMSSRSEIERAAWVPQLDPSNTFWLDIVSLQPMYPGEAANDTPRKSNLSTEICIYVQLISTVKFNLRQQLLPVQP